MDRAGNGTFRIKSEHELGGKPARVWIRMKTNHIISAHSDRIRSYERAMEKGWSRAITIRSSGTGRKKSEKNIVLNYTGISAGR